MEKVLEQKMYEVPFEGGSFTGNLVEVIGERKVLVDGKVLDQYIYNIVGYKAKNGKPFVALKPNIMIFK